VNQQNSNQSAKMKSVTRYSTASGLLSDDIGLGTRSNVKKQKKIVVMANTRYETYEILMVPVLSFINEALKKKINKMKLNNKNMY